jgi:hypothetical protein
MASSATRYTLSGRTVESAFALPELQRSAQPHADWTITMAAGRSPATARWFHHWTDERGRRWLSFGRSGADYVLRFMRLGSFRLSLATRTILCERVPAVPAHTTRHLLLDHVLPLALGTEQVVLHAGAVSMPAGAVAFAGRGGAGKSTLIAALARRGHPLLADDAVRVTRHAERHEAHPGYPSLRLWPDVHRSLFGTSAQSRRATHYSAKRRIAASGLLPVADGSTPLAAICLLDRRRRAGSVSMRALSPKEALMDLLPLTFQLDVGHARQLRETMEHVADLVEHVPVVSLSYPRRLGRLPGVVDEIERLWGAAELKLRPAVRS